MGMKEEKMCRKKKKQKEEMIGLSSRGPEKEGEAFCILPVVTVRWHKRRYRTTVPKNVTTHLCGNFCPLLSVYRSIGVLIVIQTTILLRYWVHVKPEV